MSGAHASRLPDRDRLELYRRAVQSPEREVALFTRWFVRARGRRPLVLREDFSGGAATSLAWIESDDDREAEAVDLDPSVLAHARAAARGLDEGESSRLSLVCADAARRSDREFDLIAAMNFSWATLEERALGAYLEAARESLAPDGLLALEFFGGPRLRVPHRIRRPVDDFVYEFEVESYRAPWMRAALHFEVQGRRHARAFTYRFWLRTPDVLDAALRRAGLTQITWHYEDRTGRYTRRSGRPRAPLWTAVVLAGR